jgi:hypothetical protein
MTDGRLLVKLMVLAMTPPVSSVRKVEALKTVIDAAGV